MRAGSMRFAVIGVLAVTLTACGGGGGDTGSGVTPPTPVAPTVSLSAATLELRGIGATGTSTATLTPSGATVAWRSENPSIATISGSGVNATITAVAAGSTQIVATATNGALTAEARVTITVVPIVRTIAITTASANVAIAKTQQLTANVTGDAGANTKVTWSSSDVTRALVDTLGVVTGVAPGPVSIIATSVATPTVSGQAAITVFEPARVRSVAVAPTTDTAMVGQQRTFVATVVVDSLLAKTVTWRTTNNAIATVSAAGVASAVAPGTTTITAVSTVDTTVRASATLVVRAPGVTAISLAIRSTNFLTGDTASVVPTVTADAGASTALTFSTSASSVATVALVGTKGYVSTIAPGMVTITATSVQTPSVQASVVLKVDLPATLTQWTESNDGRTANANILPAISSLGTLASGTIVAVGLDGAIAERTGTQWQRVTSPTNHRLHEVSVTSNGAWAVGGGGTVLRRAAGGWVTESFPATDSLLRVIIREDGSGSALSATNNRIFERSTAGVWTLVNTPYDLLDYLRRFGVTRNGSPIYSYVPTTSPLYPTADIMRWNGGSWDPLPRHATGSDRGATPIVAADGTLYIAGSENFKVYIARWTGAAWVREYFEAVGTTANGASFWACSDGTLLATTVRGELLRRNSGTWLSLPLGNAAQMLVGTVACTSPTDVVGGATSRLWRYNGATFVYDAFSMSLDRLSVGSATNAWASTGRSDVALQYDGTTWRGVPLRPGGSFNNTAPALAAFANGGAFVITSDHNATRAGSTWNWVTNSDTRATEVWGTSETDLWAVGSSIATQRGLARRVGSTWTTVTPNAFEFSNFAAVHGANSNAVIAAVNAFPGVVARWNGTALKFDTIAGSNSIIDVAVLSSTEAMAISLFGSHRWNGTSWSAQINCCGNETAVTIAGRAPGEYYIFGSNGGVYAYVANAWRKVSQLSRVVRKARMTADAAIAVGDDGLIVYGRPTMSALRKR